MKQLLDKIVGWLNKIPADKYKHFAAGTAVAAVVLLAVALFVSKWLALTASVVAVIAAAVGKEKVDAKADLRDIVATLCGGAVVWITYLIG
ncbi:hypothetical protein [uncultured Alistipes sp.]|uniref:hypothetical protein n=1 Tax=uncultured Alistipes sp. TaxID=538949 RepID=UPI003208C6F2